MLSKLAAIFFGGAVAIGLSVSPATADCRAQGRKNPASGLYEIVCPTHVACDNGVACDYDVADYRNEQGLGSVYVDCVCPGEVPGPLPCAALAHYEYYLLNGNIVRAIVWNCHYPDLCTPPKSECKELPYTGWITTPFYLCDC